MLKDYLNRKNMSVYSLSKGSGVPYTTVNELVNNKKKIDECSYKTVSKLAAYLGIPVERLIDIANSDLSIGPQLSTTWNDAKEKKFVFPIIVASDNYDASRIHPLKQGLAYKVTEKLKTDKRIAELTLFGSSTNIRCNSRSDTDFAISLAPESVCEEVKDEISGEIQKICDWKADIIWLDRIDKSSRIYNNIARGVRLI